MDKSKHCLDKSILFNIIFIQKMEEKIGESMKTLPCRACKKDIAFIVSINTGKRILVDPLSVLIENLDEKRIIITDQGETIKNPAIGTIGFTPHWSTCTDPNRFRVRKGHKF